MAKEAGLASAFYTSIYDLSGDLGALNSIGLTRALQDVTGLDKDGTERIALRGDVSVEFTGFWDPAVVIPVFGDLSNERTLVVAFPGATATCAVTLSAFNVTRAQDGSLGWTASAAQSDGASISTVWATA